MKKYVSYALILGLGLLLGWLLFHNSKSDKKVSESNTETAKGQMWTCSMHPQIMKSEPGDCPICGMTLIPAETGASGLNPDEFKLTDNAVALANVQTYIVKENDGKTSTSAKEHGIRLSGKIKENENVDEVQVTHFAGRIESLNVNYVGQKVSKGQLLASIYSPELVAAQQELITTSAIKDSQQDLYKAVREKLKLWRLSESQINQIETSGKITESFSVYAEVAGTVSKMMVEKGDYVNRGQGLFMISNLNALWAIFDVYENQIADVKLGESIKIKSNAYPNKTFNGRISFIYPTLDEPTRTIKVRADLSNDGKLKPGMFVEGLIAEKKTGAEKPISIPASAVLWTGKRSVVYVKTKPDEPVFEMREVELGTKIGETYNIQSGLEIGEEIVTNGTFTIDAAAQLQGKKSMMSRGDKSMSEHEGMNDMEGQMNEVRYEVSNTFQKQLKSVFDKYISMKDGLTEDNADVAQANAKKMLTELKNVDMKLLKDKAHMHWMTLEKGIKDNAQMLSASSDLEKQRKYFKALSGSLVKAVKAFGINQKVYSQFCPMADDNKGAYWLSTEEQIRNPYFGAKMSKCGEVKEEIE